MMPPRELTRDAARRSAASMARAPLRVCRKHADKRGDAFAAAWLRAYVDAEGAIITRAMAGGVMPGTARGD